jgi:hypothetical protein
MPQGSEGCEIDASQRSFSFLSLRLSRLFGFSARQTRSGLLERFRIQQNANEPQRRDRRREKMIHVLVVCAL